MSTTAALPGGRRRLGRTTMLASEPSTVYAPRPDRPGDAEQLRGMLAVSGERWRLGAPARLSHVRRGRLLRLVAEQARLPPRRRARTPARGVVRARRGLGLVLRGRG